MQAIFTGNPDHNRTSFLNWRTDGDDLGNILAMAEGYLDAALELGQSCLYDNRHKKADILVFPMLTNANHGIELYLKALVWMLNILTNKQRKIEGGHNIKQILETVKSRIREYKGQASLDEFNEATESLQLYIDELFRIIKATSKNDKMDFSRYPITSDYENHFYVDALGTVQVDLENFIERFTLIRDSLENIASYYYYQELKQDWK